MLVTNLALLGASILLYRLAEDEFGATVADRSVWYLLIFPASFFGSAIYSESLFLLGAVGALYFARRGSWPVAALFGFCAGFSRLIGVVVAPMLATAVVARFAEAVVRNSLFRSAYELFFIPVPAAEKAAAEGIRIIAIGLGNEEQGTRIPIMGTYGEKTFLK